MALVWMGFEDTDDGVRILTNDSRIEIIRGARNPLTSTAAQRIVADLLDTFCGQSEASIEAGGIAIH